MLMLAGRITTIDMAASTLLHYQQAQKELEQRFSLSAACLMSRLTSTTPHKSVAPSQHCAQSAEAHRAHKLAVLLSWLRPGMTGICPAVQGGRATEVH